MKFSEVIGQQAVKERLIQSAMGGRVSHAQLFWGPPGSGKLALALAYAQYLQCLSPSETDSCGTCSACVKASRLTHPDIHFVYPTTTTKKVKKDPESKFFSEEWRSFVIENKGYVGLNQWYDFLGVENKQGTIFARDAAEILRRLSFKAYEGKFRVMIIWMVEKLHVSAANKLLKLLEEPPENIVFILLSEQTEQILTTIKSRAFMVKVPRIADDSISHALAEKYNQRIADVRSHALMSHGNWLEACRLMENSDDEKYNFHTAQQWMRLCFKGNVPELIDFCANIATIGRERQKSFLGFTLQLFRHSVLSNYHLSDFVRVTADELNFTEKFAPFVHPGNMLQLVELIEEGIRQIERNVAPQIMFMDISLKMIKLLRMKA